MKLLREIDIPPLWLALSAGLAWAQARFLPVGPPGLPPAGWALILLGAALLLGAAAQMARARTTVIPRRDPARLVTTGLFAVSRNPIYLGDALILAGLAVFWGAWPSLILVPAFMALIQTRFILGEEAALRAAFGAEFEAWAGRVRRWL